MRRVATEHSRNDGSKAQYYVVILDRLQDRSRGLERAPELRIRGPLTDNLYKMYVVVVTATTLLLKQGAQVHDWASNGYLWRAKLVS